MAHDYCHDRDLFENEIKDTIWNWFEISFSDIENSVKDNNLIIYPKVDFKNAVWACYQKQ
jgi:hypothetical protein